MPVAYLEILLSYLYVIIETLLLSESCVDNSFQYVLLKMKLD